MKVPADVFTHSLRVYRGLASAKHVRYSVEGGLRRELCGATELKSEVRIQLAVERLPGIIPCHGAGKAWTESQQFR